MEKPKQNNFILFLLIGLIIMACGLVGFLYHMFSSEGGQCLSNPMVYAEGKMEQRNNGSINIVCDCRESAGSINLDLDLGMEGDFKWNEE